MFTAAWKHHYEHNDHHPEYFVLNYKARDTKGTPLYKGVDGMNLKKFSHSFH